MIFRAASLIPWAEFAGEGARPTRYTLLKNS